MISVKDILKVSGYEHGGCSPIGMKKLFATFIDCKAQAFESIIVSGGRIGVQIEVQTEDLIKMVKGAFADLTI